jgi:hypothetical protein
LAKPNYQFEKRQKELAKKNKKEEKRKKKAAGSTAADDSCQENPSEAVPATSEGQAISDTGVVGVKSEFVK